MIGGHIHTISTGAKTVLRPSLRKSFLLNFFIIAKRYKLTSLNTFYSQYQQLLQYKCSRRMDGFAYDDLT